MADRPINVLLVEDDEDDFVMTRRLLAGDEPGRFAMTWARSLQAAAECLRRADTDVVVLDLSLPDSHGWDTFTKVHEAAPNAPVILLTGTSDEALGVEAVKKGAQDYLVKGSTNRPQLVRAIRYAIERKRSEEALRIYRDHLEELVRRRTAQLREANEVLQREIAERRQAEDKLRQAVARLEEHDQAKSQFVSNCSHELKTPLASMSYALENMLKGVVGDLPDRVRAYAEMLNEDCQRLTATVMDILDVTRIEANRLTLNRVKLPFARFVRETADSLRLQMQSKRLNVQMRGMDQTVFAACDPQKMGRAIGNVVHNAIKFTPDGGSLELVLRPGPDAQGYLVLDVLDTGVGIEPQYIGRVTERYFRVGEHVTGTGLGLALCKDILELHGGRIELRSPPPGRSAGTQASLYVPSVRPPLVLVVDDEPQVRELLHTQLAAHGYEVIGCASGQEALESIRGGKTEILVLDLILPDMDGVEIIARIKSQHDWRRLPIVVITGAEVDKARREILQGFAIPAFAKPWKQDDLVRCLEEAAVGKHYLRA